LRNLHDRANTLAAGIALAIGREIRHDRLVDVCPRTEAGADGVWFSGRQSPDLHELLKSASPEPRSSSDTVESGVPAPASQLRAPSVRRLHGIAWMSALSRSVAAGRGAQKVVSLLRADSHRPVTPHETHVIPRSRAARVTLVIIRRHNPKRLAMTSLKRRPNWSHPFDLHSVRPPGFLAGRTFLPAVRVDGASLPLIARRSALANHYSLVAQIETDLPWTCLKADSQTGPRCPRTAIRSHRIVGQFDQLPVTFRSPQPP
jgi:hypothetical protein